MPTENPYTSEQEIIVAISQAISDGMAQSACIWNIIRAEKGEFVESTETRREWYQRYHEIIAFIKGKGLYISEPSQLVLGFKKDVSRILEGFGRIIHSF